jgi:replicative DNA helicase
MTQLLPNSRTAEQVILSHIVLNKPKADTIFNRISIDMFYSNDYKIIYKAICDIRSRNIEVNIDTITDQLINSKLDINNYDHILSELINKSSSIGKIESYLILLLDKYLRRSLMISASYISQLANDNSLSLESVFDQAEKLLLNVTQKKPNLGLLPASEVLLETFLDLEKRSKDGQLAGIPSGFFDLDSLTQGFQKSDLIIIAGRPSMGKTAFALNIARNVADSNNFPVVIFSLEMSRSQLIYRFLSSEANITNSKLRSGNINADDWKAVNRAIGSLSDLNIYLDDKSDITISDIRAKLDNLKSRFGNIGIVIIDYLQLISDTKSKDSRVQELSNITRSLKLLAKDLNVPIIVLSQLSRNVESRINKKPLLSDLRESGCLSGLTSLYISLQNTKLVSLVNKNKISLLGATQKSNQIELSHSDVKSIFITGFHLTYKLFAIGHRYVKLTSNHKILTQNGWTKLDSLSSLDLVSVVDRNNLLHVYKDSFSLKTLSYFSFLMVSNILPARQEIVYDCWLPKTNNFLANGYLLHNSIEQDADLVLMLYRQQYYEQDDAKQDLADITIAKHRNGPTGTVKLIFDSESASFGNIVTP